MPQARRKALVPPDLGNGLIQDHRRYLNRLVDEKGFKEAKVAAIDYIFASMTWLPSMTLIGTRSSASQQMLNSTY
jgi:hypothetical protein